MTLVTVREDEPTWLPGVRLRDVPYPLPATVRFFARADELGIDAQGVVGSIPLATGDTLQILPKVGQANFLRMLFRSLGSHAEFKRQFDGFVDYATVADESLADLAARQLVLAADAILRHGPSTTRVREVRRMGSASGQVLPMPTVLAVARHESDPVFARVSVRSRDTPEHRVVLRALGSAATLLGGAERQSALAVRGRWARRISDASLDPIDLLVVEERLARHRYGGPRDYYSQAITLALVLLGTLGMSLSLNPTLQGEPVLLNSADVFEKFVRRVIADHYGPRGYIVTKGGSVALSLYQDGTFGIEPDVVIEHHSTVLLVADAKYKEPSSNDHYQMLAYLSTVGINVGVLITPHAHSDAVKLTQHKTVRGLTTYVADLPIGDLPKSESFLGELLDRCPA